MEKLKIFVLAKAASFSDHCAGVAADVFSSRFASDTVQFSNAEPDSFDTFKYFGHLITKIKLRFDRTRFECKPPEISGYRKLLQQINLNSRNLLTEFAIEYTGDCLADNFDDIKGPFESVETVLFDFKNIFVRTHNMRLNAIFPNVRHLELNYEAVTDSNFVDGTYPKLEELSIAGQLMNPLFEEKFTNLLQQNPQIRQLSLKDPTYRTLQLVNKHLTNLDEFHIHGSIEEDLSKEEIAFPLIKKLEIRLQTNKCSLPKRIKFNPDLEDLLLYCSYSEIGDDYFAFLSKFPQVKNLSAGVSLNKEHFSKLIGKFPKLTKAKFGLQNDLTADDIAEFVKKSEQLNELQFLYISNPNADAFAEQLSSHIGEDFNILFAPSPAATVEFLVERKVPSDSGANVVLASGTLLLLVSLHINRLLLF